MIPAILDTNVVVSWLVAQNASSFPAQIDKAMRRHAVLAVLSTALLKEYTEVLLRGHIQVCHGLSTEGLEGYLATMVAESRMVVPTASQLVAPDPGDQHLWDLLEAAPEAVLVSGDRRLLASGAFPGRILSPRAFVEQHLAG